LVYLWALVMTPLSNLSSLTRLVWVLAKQAARQVQFPLHDPYRSWRPLGITGMAKTALRGAPRHRVPSRATTPDQSPGLCLGVVHLDIAALNVAGPGVGGVGAQL
jgi:hypothetical protein